MAVVILCGLATSAALILFVLPALYLRFGAGQPRSQTQAQSPGPKEKTSDLAPEYGGERPIGSTVQ